jgi:ABC-type sugar transport system substrate-binding protein
VNLSERHVREFARACVRAGLMSPEELHAEVVSAIAADLPDHGGDADSLARAWLQEAREDLERDQAGWRAPTDYYLLQTAFAELRDADVVVLQGCEDHWAAKAVLDARATEGARPAGIAWFTPPGVWHAVDEGMLEVNLWQGSTANAATGDDLPHEVLETLERNGVDAHFDEGRIEVAAHWHRRDVP